MKERITRVLRRISYFLFALFISSALWMYVEITENRLQELDVPVREIILKNQDLLSSRRLLVSSVLTDNLVLTFEGTRSEISNLRTGAVSVEVDLESVREAGTAALDYTVILPDNVSESSVSIKGWSTAQVLLLIDRLLTQEFPVDVKYTGGTASDEYMAEDAVFEPRTIMVSGPETIIAQIAKISVPIAAENLSTTYTSDLGIVLLDEDGQILDIEQLEDEALTFNPETIRVTVPIRQLKVLPLHVELSHGVTTSDSNVTWSAEPSHITVAGDPDALREINRITLGTIDMTSFGLRTERRLPIGLPDGLTNISGEVEATVILDVQGLEVDWRDGITDLQVVNVPPGLNADIRTQSSEVRIRGTAADLALIDSDNLWIVADLTEYGTGTSSILSRVYTKGTNAQIDIISEVRLLVTIYEDNEELP